MENELPFVPMGEPDEDFLFNFDAAEAQEEREAIREAEEEIGVAF